MAEAAPRRIGGLQIAIIALVVVTALIHLQRALGMSGGPPAGALPGGNPGGAPGSSGGPPPGGGPPGMGLMQMLPVPLPVLFLLNGVGYLALVAALYLPQLRRFQGAVRWALVAFTAVTIIGYFAIAGLAPNPVGLADKAVELALIALLLVEWRRATRPADAPGVAVAA